MDSNTVIFCTISARGGSKGVPGKNIKKLAGKPLIVWTLETAKKSGVFEQISVSSDSDEILEVARENGADILIKRPDELATDKASKLDSIKHCVTQTEVQCGKSADIIVDLDVTSPLRSVEDILACIELMKKEGTTNVITGSPARRSPYFNLVEENETGYVSLAKKLDKEIIRRQDAPKCYDMNASIYVWTKESLMDSNSLFGIQTRIYEMPEERSLDIDTELDFEVVEYLLSKRGKA
jgi:CMP-N,N'-diacetyllegionaminic acid synthase